MARFVTRLECVLCGERYDAGEIHGLCPAFGRPLWVRYDLDTVRRRFVRNVLVAPPGTPICLLPLPAGPFRRASVKGTSTARRKIAESQMINLYAQKQICQTGPS